MTCIDVLTLTGIITPCCLGAAIAASLSLCMPLRVFCICKHEVLEPYTDCCMIMSGCGHEPALLRL